MAEFVIAFTGLTWVDEGTPFHKVVLDLQGTFESECADMTHWSTEDYEKQWFSELRHVTTSREKGALIVSLHNPAEGYRVWTWTMWKHENLVRFQNRLLFMLEPSAMFDPMSVHEFIGDYQSHDEEGHPLSEWTVSIAAIQNFLARRD